MFVFRVRTELFLSAFSDLQNLSGNAEPECGLTHSPAPPARFRSAKLADLRAGRPASFPRCGSSPMSGFDAKEWRDLDWRCCNPKRLHTPESRCPWSCDCTDPRKI